MPRWTAVGAFLKGTRSDRVPSSERSRLALPRAPRLHHRLRVRGCRRRILSRVPVRHAQLPAGCIRRLCPGRSAPRSGCSASTVQCRRGWSATWHHADRRLAHAVSLQYVGALIFAGGASAVGDARRSLPSRSSLGPLPQRERFADAGRGDGGNNGTDLPRVAGISAIEQAEESPSAPFWRGSDLPSRRIRWIS